MRKNTPTMEFETKKRFTLLGEYHLNKIWLPKKRAPSLCDKKGGNKNNPLEKVL